MAERTPKAEPLLQTPKRQRVSLISRSNLERHRPLSVREGAALIGISAQRLAEHIRRGDLPASTLNGLDYVVIREDVLEWDARRRHSPGHPSRAELRDREQRRPVNLARIARVQSKRINFEPLNDPFLNP